MKIIVCFTPLHVLIATRIIEIENITDYIFIYFVDSDTEKNRYYYEQLSKNAKFHSYIILKKQIISDLVVVYKLFRQLKNYLNDEIVYYTGKIKSTHLRFLMLLTGFKTLKTFDDGSGNISGAGYFYQDDEIKLFKLIFLFFNKKLVYKNIKKIINTHYTIFDFPNVFQNQKLISLFKDRKINHIEEKEVLTILLTNAFAEDKEMNLEDEILLYTRIISKYNITHIIKHPREIYQKIENKNIIEFNNPKISEELIYELSKKYDLTVIGIYSTALLNLAQLENIHLINIHADLQKPLTGLQDLMKDLTVYV